jgi:hypothetical protein
MNLNLSLEKRPSTFKSFTVNSNPLSTFSLTYQQIPFKKKCLNPISFELWKDMYSEYLYDLRELFITHLDEVYNVKVQSEEIDESFCHFIYTNSSKFRIL